jgi:O-antigen ligase
MCIPLILSISKFLHVLHWRDADPGHLFYNHILTGFLFAFAAFLAIERYFFSHKALYLGFFVLFSIEVLAINIGRLSYVLYLALSTYSFWPRLQWRTKFFAFIVLTCFLVFFYNYSPSMHTALNALRNEIDAAMHGQMTHSLGFRIRFNQFSWQLFQEHMWIGHGMGGFVYWFNHLNPMPDWPEQANAHSQYAMILVETGLIGMGLFMIFAYHLYQKAQTSPFWGRIFIGLGIAILINGFTDNVFNYCVNYLFLAFTSIMLAQSQDIEDGKTF